MANNVNSKNNKIWGVGSTWTPKVRKIMAFMDIIMGLGMLFYILLGCRYGSDPKFLEQLSAGCCLLLASG